MKIENHWLVKENDLEKFVKKPSQNALDPIIPKYLIIHYTAGDTLKSPLNWFLNASRASTKNGGNPDAIAAHIIIDIDGSIIQLIPFNRRANHAGTSIWDGVDGFNAQSIGIEIINPGYIEKTEGGTFRRLVNEENNTYKIYNSNEAQRIKEARHKHKIWDSSEYKYWMAYTDEQIEAVIQLSKLLFTKYQLINALGHDDISPIRKPDPGPLFPWKHYKTEVLGKDNDIGKIFKVYSESDGIAQFRNTPNTDSSHKEKLLNGFEVGLIETYGAWSKVYKVNDHKDVIVKVGNKIKSIKTIGWIYSSLLKLK
jgi:N-acetylmuramoyl-L-alanine amidase